MYAYLTFANTIHVRKLTHLSLRVFVCLIIFEIVGKQHFSIFYIFLEVILASCDIWRLQDSRTINSLEEVCVTLNRDKIWSKWIQLRNFFCANSCWAHLFIFLIYIRLFWLVITEAFHLFETFQALFIFKTVILTCISCHYLGTGILTVFPIVGLLPSFQFNCKARKHLLTVLIAL